MKLNSMGGSKKRNKFEKIRAVIFDFDGTLAVLNIDFSSMKDRVFRLMRRYDVEEGSVGEKYLLEIIDEVYHTLCLKGSVRAEEFYRRAHRILHEVEMKAAGKGKLIPGTKVTLEFLREQGIKVGIVTRNCEDAVRKVFPEIDHFCDIFISRDSTRKVKPHPDHLTAVTKGLNISAREAIMVGDHVLDILAGRRVGMKTIGVLTGRTKKKEFEEAGADAVLAEASELRRLIFKPLS